MDSVEKLVIIGSGPAGLTAAIYGARGDLNPLVVSGREAGGQLMLTTDVDDYPGFPEGIQGPELMDLFRKQAERFKTRFISEDVTSVDFSSSPFIIKTETQEIKTESVIIATGASAKWLGLESERKLIGRGVSACAVCDGAFFRNKKVIVVGGGDTAMREAQHLSKYASLVTVVHRKGEFRAQAALVELLKSKENVEFLFNKTIEEFVGEEKLEKVKLKDTVNGEVEDMEIDGLFVAIGHNPNTSFLKGHIDLDEGGYIIDLDEGGYIVVHNETKTSKEGIFVAGDVSDHRYRQGVTAAGAGCKAALDVEAYLEH
jgi:thioredoxin reductase (NADPH)